MSHIQLIPTLLLVQLTLDLRLPRQRHIILISLVMNHQIHHRYQHTLVTHPRIILLLVIIWIPQLALISFITPLNLLRHRPPFLMVQIILKIQKYQILPLIVVSMTIF